MNAQPQIAPDAINIALKLEGPLNINSVEGLQEVMARYASEASELQLDLTGIETCDAAGLQLLCSLRSTALACGKPLRIVGVSEPFTSLAQALGVSTESLEVPAGMTEERCDAPVADAPIQGDSDGI